MDSEAEGRMAIANALDFIRDKVKLLETASKESSFHLVTPDLVGALVEGLTQLSEMNIRADAERLLSCGVAMWNAIICLDNPHRYAEYSDDFIHLLVRLRHVSCDTMMVAISTLDCVSSHFNMDESSILRFYTTCARRYLQVNSVEDASTCFAKADEFMLKAKSKMTDNPGNEPKPDFKKAVFQLLLGRAECMWTLQKYDEAKSMISQARNFISASDDAEQLANIMYNFAVFEYKESGYPENAIEWLDKSLATRSVHNAERISREKQAKAALLAGVCNLSLSRFEAARARIEEAQQMHHDPLGCYLLLKIAVVQRSPDMEKLMSDICCDLNADVTLCMGSVALVHEAKMLGVAVSGYKAIYERFRTDSRAIVRLVGPRFFRALCCVGKVKEALEIIDDAFGIIDESSSDSSSEIASSILESRKLWVEIAISEGCNLVERKDYLWATELLNKAIRFVENTSPSMTLHQEAAVRRLLASSAFYAATENTPRVNTPEASSSPVHRDPQNEMDDRMSDLSSDAVPRNGCSRYVPVATCQSTLIEIAKQNASKARDLNPDDFSPRLLLFRILLLEDKPDQAAEEIRSAGAEIPYFDAGDFADAACFARDRGENSSVFTALECILNMPSRALKKSLVENKRKPSFGFFGAVLLSAVRILAQEEENECGPSKSSQSCLQKILSSGLRNVKTLGVEVSFGDSAKKDQSLKFLADTAWNNGVSAGKMKLWKAWVKFSSLSYEFHALRDSKEDAITSMRAARVMEASALVQSDEERDYTRAKLLFEEARELSEKLESTNEDAIGSKSILGIATCLAATNDDDALACFVESICQSSDSNVDMLGKLAFVCQGKDGVNPSQSGESKSRRNEMTCKLFNTMVDRLLQSADAKIDEIASTLRELISFELARGMTGNNAAKAFERAIGIVKEKEQYPREERRWLAAKSWDHAEMLFATQQNAEAKVWIDFSISVASLDNQLAVYVPQMKILQDKVASKE